MILSFQKEYMILSSGPTTYQGISISAQFPSKSDTYHLLVLFITSDSIYQIVTNDFGTCGEWINVGIVVNGGTSEGFYLEIYRNGLAYMATSSPISRDLSASYQMNPSPGIYFGSAVTTIASMANTPIASGTVSMLGRL